MKAEGREGTFKLCRYFSTWEIGFNKRTGQYIIAHRRHGLNGFSLIFYPCPSVLSVLIRVLFQFLSLSINLFHRWKTFNISTSLIFIFIHKFLPHLFQALFLSISLSQVSHFLQKRVDGHIFITILAYHILYAIEKRLQSKNGLSKLEHAERSFK